MRGEIISGINLKFNDVCQETSRLLDNTSICKEIGNVVVACCLKTVSSICILFGLIRSAGDHCHQLF